MPNAPTLRFAPSPTGFLHLGHAYSAILNHDEARRMGGRFLLRIEDIDQTRCRPEFEEAILEDLGWLGLTWDGEVLRQSDHFERYEAAIRRLADAGFLYRCFKTRKELRELAGAPHGPASPSPPTQPLLQDEEERRLAAGESFSWRLNSEAVRTAISDRPLIYPLWTDDEPKDVVVELDQLADEVLARKDFPASYHLASVLDDAGSGVDLVWRGEDLKDAAPLHRVLQELFHLPTPTYRYHDLITDDEGRRLAKRDQAATLRHLRQEGITPEQIRQRLGIG
ncbi:MAG: tRNA glutamyl-Q(34) synthetase GluQRS [Parvularcula sp.]|nr:tRNA glutamyl-Q(34) synthetase GluQRS [Parvularcula sp.]